MVNGKDENILKLLIRIPHGRHLLRAQFKAGHLPIGFSIINYCQNAPRLHKHFTNMIPYPHNPFDYFFKAGKGQCQEIIMNISGGGRDACAILSVPRVVSVTFTNEIKRFVMF